MSTVKDIEIKGEQLGEAAAGFATRVVADVFAGLFTGQDENKINKKAEIRANTFKQKALPICKDVQALKQLQDDLAAGIVAFKPYALIEGRDANNCEYDINSDN